MSDGLLVFLVGILSLFLVLHFQRSWRAVLSIWLMDCLFLGAIMLTFYGLYLVGKALIGVIL